MADDQNSDRRRAPRIQSLNLVNVEQFSREGFSADQAVGRTLDISQRGIKLELNHALPLRSTVTISLALGDKLVELEGRVRHTEALDGNMCAIGIEFLDLDDQQRIVVDQYVREHNA